MTHYDLIVLGTGGVGSAAMHQAASRGLRVLGLDRFAGGHDRGSSHGQTRIIRQAYFEHHDYVPLLLKSYEQWERLQTDLGQQLFFPVGLIEAGPLDGIVTAGVLEADARHSLGVQTLTLNQAHARFPGFHFERDWQVLFEPQAGYLLVEQCVLAHLQQALALQAKHQTGCEIDGWRPISNGFQVTTTKGKFTAQRLIITAGAWAGDLLNGLGLPFRVLRKHLHWFAGAPAEFHAPACPAYFFETQEGFFYGFPACDSRGVKVAEHSGGREVMDPLQDDRLPEPEDDRRVNAFLRRQLPTVAPQRSEHAVCFYTSTPDDHFVVDRHPNHPGVAFAAGLSGHGFKFAPVLGQALVDLAVEGRTDLPIEFLRLSRFFNPGSDTES